MTSTTEQPDWQKIIECIDAFAQAWDCAHEPPELEGFLSTGVDPQRRAELIELIKIDLEYRWKGDHPGRTLEDYAQRHPFLLDDNGRWPLDLIYEEFHIRRQRGDVIPEDEYRRRFPNEADQLDSLLGLESPDASTSIRKRGGKEKFEPGQMIDDFDLLTLLGEGSFAQVFLARQISMQRLCALKISAAQGEEHKTLAQLDHPHIVRVFSQTVLPGRSLRLLYMQYHAGGTLKEIIDAVRKRPLHERRGSHFLSALDRVLDARGEAIPLDSINRRELSDADWPQVVCWLGIRIAEALSYAHSRDVLHRDLKPANILLASDGSPKLADFNISFCKQVEGATPVAYFGGSLAYMSPEQLAACDPTRDDRPEDLDARSDLYAFGVVLWELLVGVRPFADLAWGLQGSQLLGEMIADRHRGPDVLKLPPEVPPLLQQVLLKCLHPKPGKRLASGGELARQLRLCLDRDVAEIVAPPQSSLRQRMRRSPTWSVILLTGIPNLCMSLLNIAYNYDEIVQLGHRELFRVQVELLNLIAYGSGFSLLALVMRPLRHPRAEASPVDARRRALQMPYWVAGISLAEWLMCGILFPLGLHLASGAAVLTDYLHFFTSHVINGSLAAAGGFFLVGNFVLRDLLPPRLDLERSDSDSARGLQRLDTGVQAFLAGTICLPLVAIGLAVGFTEGRGAFAVLAGLGLIGVGLAHTYARGLKRRIGVLLRIVS